MLRNLRIENLAIIDRCAIEFAEGLNVLTGETGAGKSVIIGALKLILGDRSSAGSIRTGAQSAEIEAIFELEPAGAAAAWLKANELDFGEDGALLRREITAAGRNRCFVNGRAVTLVQLRELGERLVDLHGQHEHQSLLYVERHLAALDQYGLDAQQLERFRVAFMAWTQSGQRLRELHRDERELARHKDNLRFQLREIEQAKLQPGEDEELLVTRERLRNAEKLRLAAQTAYDLLYEGEVAEAPVTVLLGRIEAELATLAAIDATSEKMAGLAAEIGALSGELAVELREYRDAIESDPERLEVIENRLEEIKRLKRKYGDSIGAILDAQLDFERELHGLENLAERIEQLTGELKHYESLLRDLSGELSQRRKKAAGKFAKELVQVLAELQMAQTRFEARLEQRPAQDHENALEIGGKRVFVSETGIDQVEFLLSPNPGEELRPLRKIASGGELSRIMLALKSLIASAGQVPVMVFDEIDAGISGLAAERVGGKMAALSAQRQLICITHLPQIAAKAGAHFAVEKSVEGGRTRMNCRRLKTDERKAELARLMSGGEITGSGLRHAGELLKKAK